MPQGWPWRWWGRWWEPPSTDSSCLVHTGPTGARRTCSQGRRLSPPTRWVSRLPRATGPPLPGHLSLRGTFLPQVSSWLFGGSALPTRLFHSFPAPHAEPMSPILPAKSASPAGCLLNVESNNRPAGHLEGRRWTPEKGQGREGPSAGAGERDSQRI